MQDMPPIPFSDEEVRNEWLQCLKYLQPDEVPDMTYREWIQVAKDTAFEVLCEEDPSHLPTYLQYVRKLQDELMFLNRNGL